MDIESPGGGSRQRRKGLGLSCRVEKQPEAWPIWRNPDDSQVETDPRREAWAAHFLATKVNSPGTLSLVQAGCSSKRSSAKPQPMTELMISLMVYFR